MNYLSVCSGIEAASVAWHPMGWKPVGFSEIEKFPSQVLAHHYPNVRNLGDMTKFKEWPDDLAPNVIVGGTPCQSFSVAGLRKGLDDPRGNLMLTFGAIAKRYRPTWVVWENVPGVLSSDGGRDFGTFLGMLGELGYGFAYRILDAQFFGVAQRRRRVFVVGHLGDWRRAAAVLFERESLSGNPAPSREARPPVAALTANGVGTCGADDNQAQAGHLIADLARCVTAGEGKRQDWETCTIIAAPTSEVIGCLNSAGGHAVPGNSVQDALSHQLIPMTAHTLRGEGFDASEDGTGRGTPFVPVSVALRGREGGGTAELGDDLAFTLRSSSGGGDKPHVLAFSCKDHGADAGDIAPTLRSMGHDGSHANGGGQVAVAFGWQEARQLATTEDHTHALTKNQTIAVQPSPTMAVRRLTPRECERLQGFPDDYTDIRPRGKDTPDGPRYKALGNSMAVPVMAWIGNRIQQVSEK